MPNNGIDEDELAGDFQNNVALPQRHRPAAISRKRHVVLVVLESTRFDALGTYIDGRPVMPNLDAIARSGSSIPEAYSHAAFTTPSIISLFSGRLEPPRNARSLVNDLKEAGYQIATFSGHDEGFGDIAERTGTRKGSDLFVDARRLVAERVSTFSSNSSLAIDDRLLLREFRRHLGTPEAWQKPNFVYFFLQAAHYPYWYRGMTKRLTRHPLTRAEIRPENRKQLMATYYNAVAYADFQLGQIIAQLKQLGVWQDTLLVVTADHGESLFDDNFLGHGHAINRQQMHIPLVINQPGITFDRPVGLEDIRWMIGDLLAGKKPRADLPGSFHYIGDLNRPAEIGNFSKAGQLTRFNLETRQVILAENSLPRHYDDLPPHSASRRRADALIQLWEARRWQAHEDQSAASAKAGRIR